MAPHHLATFTWGPGAQTVYVAGNFNNWSADATPLHKQPDGSFAAEIPLPWGEKQAFKYVVDGDWKVREDEAKEWDAAGNMNNVYTAPSAAGAAAHVPSSPTTSKTTSSSTEQHSHPSSVPPTSAPDIDAPAPAETKTEASTLIASSAPGTASHPNPLLSLGGPISFGNAKPTASTTTRTSPTTTTATSTFPETTTTTTTSTTPIAPAGTSAIGGSEQQAAADSAATVAIPAAAAHQANPEATKPLSEESLAVQREKVAAHSNVGEALTGDEPQGLAERAAEYGSAAIAAIGGALGGAAAVVERATGVDLTHSSPLTVEEAKAQGIDVHSLQKVDGTSHTASTVAPPSKEAIDDLDEKIQELKLNTSKDTTGISDVPLPNGEPPKTSIAGPATINLHGTESNEQREHDIPAQHETKDNHTTVPQPVFTTISPRDPKKDRTLASTDNSDTAGTKPISDQPGVDLHAAKANAEANPGANTTLPAAGEKKISPDAPANNNIKPVTPTGPTAPASATDAPPATPAKTAPPVPASNGVASAATPVSAASTPASTPVKSTHTRDTTTTSDVKKKKSNIFGKIKHAFSPKDKSK
ncbi:hypothetical protein CI109_102617 [Kwoniella shandongensis]|uniref:AMP-activated protein kinase glycogen-binding domain-containing protein n=1 Tax=Kwoniella shandongensis TaxID=1734106 RepID=A0AAJ8LGE9_9TREE